MKIFKFILLSFFLISIIYNNSYGLEIIKTKNETLDQIIHKMNINKDAVNIMYVPDYYIRHKEKKGVFLFKGIQLFIKLKKPYIAYYDDPTDPFKVNDVQNSFSELEINYDDGSIARVWQSASPSSNGALVDFINLNFNAKSYKIALFETEYFYQYPQPDCGAVSDRSSTRHNDDDSSLSIESKNSSIKIKAVCQKDSDFYVDPEIYSTKAKTVLIYDPATDNWIDSKYLADQRINYLASVNGKTSLKKFSAILKKQVKDLNIDLEDISPAAQTCYFLEPLEPCYKNLK